MIDEAARARLREFLDELQRDAFQFQDCESINVNTRGSTGDAPLKIAVVRGDLSASTDLLSAGADPNIQGEDGFTPLHWAAQRSPEFVRLLLAHGASDNIVNDFGDKPSDIARRYEDAAILALFHEKCT